MRARALVALAIAATATAAGSALAAGPAPATASATATASTTASASVVIAKTTVSDANGAHAPGTSDGELAGIARGLDPMLADAAQDLGLTIDLASAKAIDPKKVDDSDVLAQARHAGVTIVVPTVRASGSDIEIRITVADPSARSIRVRVEKAAKDDVGARALVMLRDLVADLDRTRPIVVTTPPPVAPGTLTLPARSQGRAILVTNAALFGGFVGFSIQKSSGSDDPRLLYPLLAVGAGVGIGASVVISEEWDVGTGDAWFLSAGTWWPTLAAHLIYEGRWGPSADHQGFNGDRFAFGLIGGTAGITLATMGLSLHGMGDGGALLAHSGGGLGLMLGGLSESFARGDIHRTPFAGAGYGAALGWLAASAVATQVEVAPTRVLFIDLGAGLGGLGGAALSSPFIFGDQTASKQRAFVGVTAGSALLGGGIAMWATRASKPSKDASLPSIFRYGEPMIGVVGESERASSLPWVAPLRAPVLGLGWNGTLDP